MGGGVRRVASGEGTNPEALLEQLHVHMRTQGVDLGPGWKAEVSTRINAVTGEPARTIHYVAPTGRRFRSRAEVERTYGPSSEEDGAAGEQKERVAAPHVSQQQQPAVATAAAAATSATAATRGPPQPRVAAPAARCRAAAAARAATGLLRLRLAGAAVPCRGDARHAPGLTVHWLGELSRPHSDLMKNLLLLPLGYAATYRDDDTGLVLRTDVVLGKGVFGRVVPVVRLTITHEWLEPLQAGGEEGRPVGERGSPGEQQQGPPGAQSGGPQGMEVDGGGGGEGGAGALVRREREVLVLEGLTIDAIKVKYKKARAKLDADLASGRCGKRKRDADGAAAVGGGTDVVGRGGGGECPSELDRALCSMREIRELAADQSFLDGAVAGASADAVGGSGGGGSAGGAAAEGGALCVGDGGGDSAEDGGRGGGDAAAALPGGNGMPAPSAAAAIAMSALLESGEAVVSEAEVRALAADDAWQDQPVPRAVTAEKPATHFSLPQQLPLFWSGLDEPSVLRRLEGLEGVPECENYAYVEQWGTWESEAELRVWEDKNVLPPDDPRADRRGTLGRSVSHQQKAAAAAVATATNAERAAAASMRALEVAAQYQQKQELQAQREASREAARRARLEAKASAREEAARLREEKRAQARADRLAAKEAEREEREAERLALEFEEACEAEAERLAEEEEARERAAATIVLKASSVPDHLLSGFETPPPRGTPLVVDPVSAGGEMSARLLSIWEMLRRFHTLLGLAESDVPSPHELARLLMAPRASPAATTRVANLHLKLLEASVSRPDDFAPPPQTEDSWPACARLVLERSIGRFCMTIDEDSGAPADAGLAAAAAAATGLPNLSRARQLKCPAGGCATCSFLQGGMGVAESALATSDDASFLATAERLLRERMARASDAGERAEAGIAAAEESVARACRFALRRVMAVDGMACKQYDQGVIDNTFQMITIQGGCGEEEDYDGEHASTMSYPLDLRTLDARLEAGAYPTGQGPDTVADWFLSGVRLVFGNLRRVFSWQGKRGAIAKFCDAAQGRIVAILEEERLSEDPAHELPRATWDRQGCRVCMCTNQPKQQVVCDACDGEYHLWCVSLTAVPEGVWRCPRCVEVNRRPKVRVPYAKQMIGGDIEGQEAEGAPKDSFLASHFLSYMEPNKPVRRRTPALRGAVGKHIQAKAALVKRMRSTEYHRLEQVERVELLHELCQIAIESDGLRAVLDADTEVTHPLKNKLRSLRRRHKEVLKDVRIMKANKTCGSDPQGGPKDAAGAGDDGAVASDDELGPVEANGDAKGGEGEGSPGQQHQTSGDENADPIHTGAQGKECGNDGKGAAKAAANSAPEGTGADPQIVPREPTLEELRAKRKAERLEVEAAMREAMLQQRKRGTRRAMLGVDRLARRYWVLGGDDGTLYVQSDSAAANAAIAAAASRSGEGDPKEEARIPTDRAGDEWVVYTGVGKIQDLVAWLQPAGLCEGPLRVELQQLLVAHKAATAAEEAKVAAEADSEARENGGGPVDVDVHIAGARASNGGDGAQEGSLPPEASGGAEAGEAEPAETPEVANARTFQRLRRQLHAIFERCVGARERASARGAAWSTMVEEAATPLDMLLCCVAVEQMLDPAQVSTQWYHWSTLPLAGSAANAGTALTSAEVAYRIAALHDAAGC